MGGGGASEEHVASRRSSGTGPPRVRVNISSGIYSDDEETIHDIHTTRKQSLIGQVRACGLALACACLALVLAHAVKWALFGSMAVWWWWCP